jgi:small subunit ribosomal protein S8
MTDPITDMFNSIRSSSAVKKPEVTLPYSKLKEQIAMILAKQGFVGEVKKVSKGTRKFLKIVLKYDQGLPQITGAKRVSKPGQRIYEGTDGIKKVHGGFGIAVISTSKGLMTGEEAKKHNMGGEIICQVW